MPGVTCFHKVQLSNVVECFKRSVHRRVGTANKLPAQPAVEAIFYRPCSPDNCVMQAEYECIAEQFTTLR